MFDKKAIVIGAGVAGLAIARALAIKGFSVTVLERHSRAIGASVRNFGMIWPIGQKAGFYEHAVRSRDIWQEMAGRGAFIMEQRGSLHLAYHADELHVLEQVSHFYKGARDMRLCTAEQAVSLSPAVNPSRLKGGLFSTEECIVDPVEAIKGAANFLQEQLGVQIRFNTFASATARNGVVTATGEKLECDVVFVCSGEDMEALYPQVFAQLPVTKCKLQMMRIAAQNGWSIGPALCGGLSLTHYKSFEVADSLAQLKARFEKEMPEYIANGIHVMVSQNSRGELTVGDSHEYGPTPAPFNSDLINQLILSYLSKFAVFPKPQITHTWNGTYAKMTDGSSYIFQSPEPGVFIFNGLGGNGMTLSFGLAEHVAQSI